MAGAMKLADDADQYDYDIYCPACGFAWTDARDHVFWVEEYGTPVLRCIHYGVSK